MDRAVPYFPIPARDFVGVDLPWLKRLLGISTAAQVASLYNEAVKQKGASTYTGCGTRRTTESDAAHKAEYDAGSDSLQVAGCIGTPLLRLRDRRMAVLHATMAIGRMLCAFINAHKPEKGLARDALQLVLNQHKTSLTVGSESSPDGEDTARPEGLGRRAYVPAGRYGHPGRRRPRGAHNVAHPLPLQASGPSGPTHVPCKTRRRCLPTGAVGVVRIGPFQDPIHALDHVA